MKWSEDVVLQTSLPASSKAFLTRIGMPYPTKAKTDVGELSWDLSLQLRSKSSGRRILAKKRNIFIIIDGDQIGQVIQEGFGAIPEHGFNVWPERYYNKSIQQYALSLTEYEKMFNGISPYIDTMLGTNDLTEKCEKEEFNLKIFESKLMEIDKTALNTENSEWSYRILLIRSYH